MPQLVASNDSAPETTISKPDPKGVAPGSKEIVIGLVGYAGAGCSTVGKNLLRELRKQGYNAMPTVKLSALISERSGVELPNIPEGADEGSAKLERARVLQNLGDELRRQHGGHAVASLAVKKIMELRAGKQPGEEKIAFVLDSIKHDEEVELLRRVYDKSFRLVAVHCERSEREFRLFGKKNQQAKYAGADEESVKAYLDRDEKDADNKHGQQVRDAFFLADYFLDNNQKSENAARITDDLERLVSLLLGTDLVRPTVQETGMFYAHAAALRSSCLSRQVGAALQTKDGTIVSTGTNEVPTYGGGVYVDGAEHDHRCFAWEWDYEEQKFKGCHNARLKNKLREDIAKWMANNFAEKLAEVAMPKKAGSLDIQAGLRAKAADGIKKFFESESEKFERMPGVKDLIEYARSIHAEMNALFNAAAQGISPKGCILYTTTFPCHNCARHLITAGIDVVYYIEPFVKSLAKQLHYDSITTDWGDVGSNKMRILPFTGVGPRMYEDHFMKRAELKNGRTGVYEKPAGEIPSVAVRLRELGHVEAAAAKLID